MKEKDDVDEKKKQKPKEKLPDSYEYRVDFVNGKLRDNICDCHH